MNILKASKLNQVYDIFVLYFIMLTKNANENENAIKYLAHVAQNVFGFERASKIPDEAKRIIENSRKEEKKKDGGES